MSVTTGLILTSIVSLFVSVMMGFTLDDLPQDKLTDRVVGGAFWLFVVLIMVGIWGKVLS